MRDTASGQALPDVITFEADGETHEAVVGLPIKPTANAMICEFDGVRYAIAIPLGTITSHPEIHYIARPVAD